MTFFSKDHNLVFKDKTLTLFIHVHPAFTCSMSKKNLLNVNNGNIRTLCGIFKLTVKTPGRHHWRRSSILVIFGQISHCSTVSTVDFEQDNASWVELFLFRFDFYDNPNIITVV